MAQGLLFKRSLTNLQSKSNSQASFRPQYTMQQTITMELLITLSLLICTTIFFLCRVFNQLISRKNHYPPGSMGLPYIGETLSYVKNIAKGIPDKFIRDRRTKYSEKIFKTSLFGENMVFLCGPEGNKFIFANEEKYVRVWWPRSVDKVFAKSANKSSQDESLKVRKNMIPFLKADLLRTYVPIMDSVMKKQMSLDWSCESVKACSLIKKFTFTLACRVFFSIEDPLELEKLSRPFAEVANGIISIPIDFPGTNFRAAIKGSKTIREALEVMIKQRRIDIAEKRSTLSQDVLSLMLSQTDDENEMSNTDIASDFVGVLIASYDSTNTTLTFVMKYLAENPAVYDEVRKEQMEIAKTKGPNEFLTLEDLQNMSYSWNVACEVIRVTPPTLGAFREVIEDFTYEGYTVPKGWKLHWIPHLTHRGPEYFKNPEKFDPSRFEGVGAPPYTFVPFGGGLRMCPGYKYARLIILVFMHNIVTKFRWEKLNPNEKIIQGGLPRPSQGLPLRLVHHKS